MALDFIWKPNRRSRAYIKHLQAQRPLRHPVTSHAPPGPRPIPNDPRVFHAFHLQADHSYLSLLGYRVDAVRAIVAGGRNMSMSVVCASLVIAERVSGVSV
eukprot:2568197-Rhodomonas_salina.4